MGSVDYKCVAGAGSGIACATGARRGSRRGTCRRIVELLGSCKQKGNEDEDGREVKLQHWRAQKKEEERKLDAN